MSYLEQDREDEASFDNFKSEKIDITGLPESYGLISFAESKTINYPKNDHEDEYNFDEGNPIASSLKEMVFVNKEQAKKLFVKYIKEQSYCNKRYAMEAKIYSMIHYNVFKYELESYSEARVITHKYKPFDGNDEIDDSSKGSIPDLWDVDNKQNELFKDCEKIIMIPHTEHIINCPGCNFLGYLECSGCSGQGKMKSDQQTKCIRCSGNGRKICSYCRGTKRLKSFLELNSKFTNHKSEYFSEDYGFPTDLLKTVTGELVLSQSLPKIFPLADPNLSEIYQNSKRLIDQHAIMYANDKRLIIQRQKLIAYSVTKCDYTWKRDFKATFWIYGKEKYVECSSYPQKCCCAIS